MSEPFQTQYKTNTPDILQTLELRYHKHNVTKTQHNNTFSHQAPIVISNHTNCGTHAKVRNWHFVYSIVIMRSKSPRRCYGVDGGCTEKQETETAACARALCRWSNARVPSLTPSSSHASHFHSPFLPPLPPLPPVSALSCPLFLYYTHLASVKQTHHQPPSPPPPLPSLHPAHPTTPHLASIPPGATLHHSHGRSKHHLLGRSITVLIGLWRRNWNAAANERPPKRSNFREDRRASGIVAFFFFFVSFGKKRRKLVAFKVLSHVWSRPVFA